jgi:sugar/nucleoside kinase (ribokinase family)
MLSAGDIFAPNLEEAISLVGPGEPVELVQRLMQAGARVAVLRMGADGSLVAQAGDSEVVHIPGGSGAGG